VPADQFPPIRRLLFDESAVQVLSFGFFVAVAMVFRVKDDDGDVSASLS
jgi:hypothetical protein